MYRVGDLNNWKGREASDENQYFYQKIKLLDLDNIKTVTSGNNYALLGFCCDEGVRRNQGRIGAKEGPVSFRKSFSALPVHNNKTNIFDAGDVICEGDGLESAHIELGNRIRQIIGKGYIPVVIGGGHETAWGHFLGLDSYFKKDSNIAILNFDAHFDLRKPANNHASSGTPFYQISEYLKNKEIDFNYYCAGVQKHANTTELFDYADNNEVNYLLAEEINKAPNDISFVEHVIENHEHIYVSICLDVFSSSIAPGVSAPQILGIFPQFVIESLKKLKASGRVISLDIVELAPSFDIDDKTAKLASTILFEYLEKSV